LAAVYGSVKQNNGFICARSEKGRGARFEILLGVAEERAVSGER
jgi:hypothetical protein